MDGVSGRRQVNVDLWLDSMGRWVGEKVEWLLDDDDDWREPWQTGPMHREAASVLCRLCPAAGTATDDSWPEDDSFRVQRWQRNAELGGQSTSPFNNRCVRRVVPCRARVGASGINGRCE